MMPWEIRRNVPEVPFGVASLMTVRDARRQLLARFRAEGEAKCHECGRPLRLQRRTVHKSIALILQEMYERRRRGWVFVPRLSESRKASDWGTVAHWGLARPRTDDEGATLRGWWAVTEKGAQWLRGEITIPRYAFVYDNQVVRFGGEDWSIEDALGSGHGFG